MTDEKIYELDGIVIDKGIVLTNGYVNENEDCIRNWLEFWLQYPDLFLDMIHDDENDPNFKLLPYQRVALRSIARYKNVSMTATRGTSKSFTSYLSYYLRCIFCAGIKLCIVADVKKTVIATAKAKFAEIFYHWPLLERELKTRSDDGEQGLKKSNDYYEISLKNGSVLTVIAKDSSRGLRENGILYEESALIDEISHNEVLQPMMVIDRREPDGTINPDAVDGQSVYITTARDKTCFMYSKLVELFVNSILRPSETFVFGMDYRVPVHYGLMRQSTIDQARLSSTFNDLSFGREYLSIWSGNSNEAWFDAEAIARCRKLLKAERKAVFRANSADSFYIMGIDVARGGNCNSAVTVLRVNPREEYYNANLVYIEIISSENFITKQAPRIKKLIQLYNPREVVIDINGLGRGLIDAMVLESFDPQTGERFPAYYAFNNETYLPQERSTPSEEPIAAYNAIIYAMIADSKGNNNSEMWSNLYSKICSGQVQLLANEQIVKNKLLATKVGQRMSLYDRRMFLMPYEMTSRLVDELNNLRLKATGVMNDIKVEQISRSTPKDRVSSLQYALWRVKHYEDTGVRRRGRRKLDGVPVFFSPRGRR